MRLYFIRKFYMEQEKEKKSHEQHVDKEIVENLIRKRATSHNNSGNDLSFAKKSC